MPANPSRFLISNDWDPKIPLREWCTCPHCLVVWTHKETMNDKADWEWAKERYTEPTTCSECGTVSVAIRKEERKSLPRHIRNEDRRIIVADAKDVSDTSQLPSEVEVPTSSRRWWSRKSREEHDS